MTTIASIAPIVAQLQCQQHKLLVSSWGGHVCREDEITAACNVLGAASITIGMWINETTGDDVYKYVNMQFCSNLDGPGTDKMVARVYRCCFGVH